LWYNSFLFAFATYIVYRSPIEQTESDVERRTCVQSTPALVCSIQSFIRIVDNFRAGLTKFKLQITLTVSVTQPIYELIRKLQSGCSCMCGTGSTPALSLCGSQFYRWTPSIDLYQAAYLFTYRC